MANVLDRVKPKLKEIIRNDPRLRDADIRVVSSLDLLMSDNVSDWARGLDATPLSDTDGITYGYYDKTTKQITIVADAFIGREDLVRFTLWHESLHMGLDLKIEEEGRGKWEDALTSTVEGNEELQRMLETAQENYPDYDINTREGKLGLYEEILADVFGAWQSGNWSRLEEKYNTEFSDRFKSGEVRTLWQRIVDTIKSIFGLNTEPNNDAVFTLLGQFKTEFDNDAGLNLLKARLGYTPSMYATVGDLIAGREDMETADVAEAGIYRKGDLVNGRLGFKAS